MKKDCQKFWGQMPGVSWWSTPVKVATHFISVQFCFNFFSSPKSLVSVQYLSYVFLREKNVRTHNTRLSHAFTMTKPPHQTIAQTASVHRPMKPAPLRTITQHPPNKPACRQLQVFASWRHESWFRSSHFVDIVRTPVPIIENTKFRRQWCPGRTPNPYKTISWSRWREEWWVDHFQGHFLVIILSF